MSSKLDTIIQEKYRDENLELEIIAYLIRKNAMLAAIVKPDWFCSAIFKNIFKVIQKYKSVLTKSSLIQTLKSRPLIVNDIAIYEVSVDEIYSADITTLTDKNIKICIENLIELYEKREVLYAMKETIKSIKSGSLDLNNTKSRFKKVSQDIKIEDNLDGTGGYVEDYSKRVEIIQQKAKLVSSGQVGIKTGIVEFDFLVGGLMPTEFGIIGGAPGCGKSMSLGFFAKSAWQLSKKNVLFISGEMPNHDIGFRLDADISRIEAIKFRMGTLDEKDYSNWSKSIQERKEKQSNFFEIVSFTRGFTTEDIELAALKAQDKYKKPVEFICVDYINIMHPNNLRNESNKNWESQADVVWEFKYFISGFNGGISGWTAGQLVDDSVGSSKLTLKSLKYARAISETAPVVVGLVVYADTEYVETTELQILKMRNAPLHTSPIILHPDKKYMRLDVDESLSKDLHEV